MVSHGFYLFIYILLEVGILEIISNLGKVADKVQNAVSLEPVESSCQYHVLHSQIVFPTEKDFILHDHNTVIKTGIFS